jgi:hypothetical protein
MTTAATKRYLVEWTPWDAVKAAAVKRGMPADGEVADYVEIDDYQTERVFSTFAAAMKFASSVAEADTWRCPRIRRQVLVQNDHDDLGNRVEPMPSFETEATWEMIDGSEPVEEQPDWLDDAA